MGVVRKKMFYDPTLVKNEQTQKLRKDRELGCYEQILDFPALYQPIPEPVMLPGFELSTDSGAHTLYKKFFVQGEKATEFARKTADYSYLETAEFKAFLDVYIQHVLDNAQAYTFYVTLDIINNPKKSWEITKYIESYGLKPIPVFHNGEDIFWLHKILDEYEYFGISGLGQDITKTKFKHFGTQCFSAICDSHGTPRARVHGFAMGAPDLLSQYPWYSADQSTWTYMSRVGSLLVPRPIIHRGSIKGFDYLSSYKVFPVTDRRRVEYLHVDHCNSKSVEYWLRAYLEPEGFTLEEAKQYYHVRDVLNIRLFDKIQKAAKELYAQRWGYEKGGNILFAGTPSGASTNLSRFCRLLYDLKMNKIHFLGTPVYKKHLTNCLEIKRCTEQNVDYRTLWSSSDAEIKAMSGKRSPSITTVQTKPKIARKPLATAPKKYQITVELTVDVISDTATKASTQLAEQLDQVFPKAQVTFKSVELGILPPVEVNKSSFDHLL